MSLKAYRAKRTPGKTPEPFTGERRTGSRRFVVQKHAASHLHYDFRLEHRGTLKSWAVPKGPSLDPNDKRLAMMVEDHPLSYRHFEGVIPKGNYGAGAVMVWDEGTYSAKGSVEEALRKGHLHFTLHGKKLRGEFSLVRMAYGDHKNGWVLMKHGDEWSSTEDVRDQDRSVRTGRPLEEIAEGRRKMHAPMLAEFVGSVSERKGWVYEVKWDGYRAVADIENGDVQLYSRNEQSFVDKFPSIVAALKKQGRNMVLDGEVVVLDEQGVSRFQLLQNYLETGEGALVYYVFDLLFLDGEDLRSLPLLERKKKLQQALKTSGVIRYSDHVQDAHAMWKFVEERGLEGMMAKNGAGVYRSGARSADWLKVKTKMRQEAAIGGFTMPRGSRKGFGALVLGVYDGDRLEYIGHTGGGFTDDQIVDVLRRLKPLVRKSSPFSPVPKTNMPATWVTPRLMCEIEFQEWTNDGHMRKPIFIGLRGERSSTKNPDKVLWPKEKITKADLVAYYRRIAPVILPYLKDRPESLNRHPNGIAGESFYQKDMKDEVPSFAQTKRIASEHSEKEIRYLICNNAETLEYMANLGCIELHPWLSRVASLDRPDFTLIDLDPSPRTPFMKVVETAKAFRDLLEELDVPSVVKTSGKTGLHICVPFGAKYTYEQSRQFAEILARIIHARLPKITTVERSLSKRPSGVYLDYLQNRRGQTMTAPYCVRPEPGAPVSTPLMWKEVNARLNPKRFTLKTIFQRVEKYGDLWKPVLGPSIDLVATLERLQKEK